MWRITKQSVALLLVAVLFLASPCSYFHASYNDVRFDAYENMNPDDDRPGYVVPTLYRQDSVYQYAKTYPLVVSGSVEYVPISIFTQFSNLSVTYSRTSENFYMSDSKTGRFVTFDVKKNIAQTSNGDLMRTNTRIFYSTRYVSARDVAEIFDLTVEIYDDVQAGVYALRISDSSRKYTFSQLMEQYLPKKKVQSDVKEPEVYDEPSPSVTQDPKEDEYAKVASRSVYMIFDSLRAEGAKETLAILSQLKATGIFAVTYQDVLKAPDLVRGVLVNNSSLAVTATDIDTQLDEDEYISELVSRYERVNKALSVVCKQKTRLCILPDNIPENIKNSKALYTKLDENGYVPVMADYYAQDDTTKQTVKPYTVAFQVKEKIVNADNADKPASIFVSFDVSKHTRTYISEIVRFLNNYRQFKVCKVNEAVCTQKITQ